MNVRITEHTRRKPNGPKCRGWCREVIQPGDRYRQLVAINHEGFNDDFTLIVVHTGCIRVGEADLWAVT